MNCIGIICWLGLASLALAGRPVALVEMKPVATEYGMVKDPVGLSTVEGPGQMDMGSWGQHNAFFWPDNTKIVKFADRARKLPEGERYNSRMPDAFAVRGEWITGVGLWVRTRNMYHWLEYDVPTGATRFTATLYVTDDPRGYVFYDRPIHQQFAFTVTVDGRELTRVEKIRLDLSPGSGEELADLDVAIPAGARRIRFRLEASSWGDGNNNTELVLHDGQFLP